MIPIIGRLLIALLVLGFVWQVILPIVRDQPVFPLFRRKKDGRSRLDEAEARKREALRNREAARLEKEAERIENDTDAPGKN